MVGKHKGKDKMNMPSHGKLNVSIVDREVGLDKGLKRRELIKDLIRITDAIRNVAQGK